MYISSQRPKANVFIKLKTFINKNDINLLIIATLWAYLTPSIGILLTAIGIPCSFELGEELSKALSCTFGGVFALVSSLSFALGEMMSYVTDHYTAVNECGFLTTFVTFRGICVLFHLSLLGIHWGGYKMAAKLSGYDKLRTRLATFAIAISLHITWNSSLGKWLLFDVMI